jgi:hypothetical protein
VGEEQSGDFVLFDVRTQVEARGYYRRSCHPIPEDDMPERQAERSKKQGVHGWRAFSLVFGCGTAAALVMVGGVVVVARTLGSAVTGEERPNEQVAGTWEPAPSMSPGALDLCRTMETSSQTGAFKSMYPDRVDGEDGYVDSGPEDPERVVKDECEWLLQSAEYGEWSFRLSYEASVSQEGEEARVEQAGELYDTMSDSLSTDFAAVASEEEMDDIADEASAHYGKPATGDEGSLYVLLGRTRSGVFSIQVQSTDQDVPEEEFRELALKISPVLSRRFERVLPR